MAHIASCYPKLYVYELERQWQDPGQKNIKNFAGQTSASTQPLIVLDAIVVHPVGQFALGEVVLQRAMSYHSHMQTETPLRLIAVNYNF